MGIIVEEKTGKSKRKTSVKKADTKRKAAKRRVGKLYKKVSTDGKITKAEQRSLTASKKRLQRTGKEISRKKKV